MFKAVGAIGICAAIMSSGCINSDDDVDAYKVLIEIKNEVNAYQIYVSSLRRAAADLRYIRQYFPALPRIDEIEGSDHCGGAPRFVITAAELDLKTVISDDKSAGGSLKIPVASGLGSVAPSFLYDNSRTDTQELTFYEYPRQAKGIEYSPGSLDNKPIATAIFQLEQALIKSAAVNPCMDYVKVPSKPLKVAAGGKAEGSNSKQDTFSVTFEIKNTSSVGLGFTFVLLNTNAARKRSNDLSNKIVVTFEPDQQDGQSTSSLPLISNDLRNINIKQNVLPENTFNDWLYQFVGLSRNGFPKSYSKGVSYCSADLPFDQVQSLQCLK